eukprot:4982545-Amphidinium_carterae.5
MGSALLAVVLVLTSGRTIMPDAVADRVVERVVSCHKGAEVSLVLVVDEALVDSRGSGSRKWGLMGGKWLYARAPDQVLQIGVRSGDGQVVEGVRGNEGVRHV